MTCPPVTETEDWVARGNALIESGKYASPRGAYLGRIEHWGIDVYQGSPEEWKDALLAEVSNAPK
jgi:hypothetical protein